MTAEYGAVYKGADDMFVDIRKLTRQQVKEFLETAGWAWDDAKSIEGERNRRDCEALVNEAYRRGFKAGIERGAVVKAMTDRYERIRKALAMGPTPTPGPWSVRYDYVVQAKSFDEDRLVPIAQPYGLRGDGSDLFANAALIAACDPDTIRALAAENARLREALEQEAGR